MNISTHTQTIGSLALENDNRFNFIHKINLNDLEDHFDFLELTNIDSPYRPENFSTS